MSRVGREGREMETRRLSTSAQKRKMTPGIHEARADISAIGVRRRDAEREATV